MILFKLLLKLVFGESLLYNDFRYVINLKGYLKIVMTTLIKVTLLAMIGVFIIDSMLNFPISRPISYVFILFVLVSSINLKNIVKDEK